MRKILHHIWLNIKNLRYVRRHNVSYRGTKLEWLMAHEKEQTGTDEERREVLFREITDYMVSAVGLAVVDDDKDTIPRWFVLTPHQRRVRKKVSPYKLGLRNAKTTWRGPGPQQAGR